MPHETVYYTHHDSNLKAYVAYPEGKGPFPTILLAHAWAGRDKFVCDKASAIAKLGYVGFALDMFGDAKVGTSNEENEKLIQPFMQDRNFLRERMLLAFTTARELPHVNKEKMGVMGFCFGGLCALDLARSGASLKGTVSFHALLSAPSGVKTEKIQSKILALHGHDDPMATPHDVLQFQTEMTKAGVDWQMHIYGQTQHAFTNPAAQDSNLGLIYNTNADKRSWLAMKNFWAEVF